MKSDKVVSTHSVERGACETTCVTFMLGGATRCSLGVMVLMVELLGRQSIGGHEADHGEPAHACLLYNIACSSSACFSNLMYRTHGGVKSRVIAHIYRERDDSPPPSVRPTFFKTHSQASS